MSRHFPHGFACCFGVKNGYRENLLVRYMILEYIYVMNFEYRILGTADFQYGIFLDGGSSTEMLRTVAPSWLTAEGTQNSE